MVCSRPPPTEGNHTQIFPSCWKSLVLAFFQLLAPYVFTCTPNLIPRHDASKVEAGKCGGVWGEGREKDPDSVLYASLWCQGWSRMFPLCFPKEEPTADNETHALPPSPPPTSKQSSWMGTVKTRRHRYNFDWQINGSITSDHCFSVTEVWSADCCVFSLSVLCTECIGWRRRNVCKLQFFAKKAAYLIRLMCIRQDQFRTSSLKLHETNVYDKEIKYTAYMCHWACKLSWVSQLGDAISDWQRKCAVS